VHSNTPQITRRTRAFFGSGGLVNGVVQNAHYFVLVYYSQILGLSPELAGLALSVGLIFDAVSDPLVGYLSDNTKSRLGRRHPYLYASVVPLALSYFLLWHPPPSVHGDMNLFLYLVACNVALRISLTLFLVPAYAFVAELTSDYEERTRLLTGFNSVLSVVGNGMSFLMYAIWLVPTDEIADGIMNAEGYRQAGLFGSLAIALAILIFSFGLHRFVPRSREYVIQQSVGPNQFYVQVRDAFRSPPIRSIMVAGMLYWAGSGTYAALWVYIYSYFWEFTSQQLALIVTPMVLAGAFLSPIMSRLSRGREKRRVAIFGLLGASFVNVFPIAMRLIGVFPDNDTEALFFIMLGLAFFETLLFLVFDVCWRSMTADVTEQMELTTGRRNEGVISSTMTFAAKCSASVGTLIAGLLLAFIAFPTETAVGEVPPDTLFDLGLIYGPLVLVFFLAAAYATSRYGISRADHGTHVSRLEQRSD
jgi:GPH family glycoside/pentoside/hexuronide:cation symporter